MLDTDIAIIGGGVGALTLGVAAAQRGLSFRIYERQDQLWRGGGGIKLWPNAMRAYRYLGLDERVAARGSAIRTGVVQSVSGRLLNQLDLGKIEAALGLPIVSLPRAPLVELLAEQLPEDAIAFGRCFTGLEQADGPMRVRFADGSEARARVVVGVDGAHSSVREQLFPGSVLRYEGRISWRGMVPLERGERLPGPHESWEVFGAGGRFGYAPMGPGLVGWYAPLPSAEDFQPASIRDHLLEQLAGWPDPVTRLVERTPEFLRSPIRYRPIEEPWGKGAVTLMGDAAHTMTPDLAQGACQAIEDAVVLAAELAEHGPTPEALRAYEARRAARIEEVVTRSLKIGRMSSRTGRIAAWMRTAMWRFMPEKIALGGMQDLVGYDCLEDDYNR